MAKQAYNSIEVLDKLKAETAFVIKANKFYRALERYKENLAEYHEAVPKNMRTRHVSQLEKEIRTHLESEQ